MIDIVMHVIPLWTPLGSCAVLTLCDALRCLSIIGTVAMDQNNRAGGSHLILGATRLLWLTCQQQEQQFSFVVYGVMFVCVFVMSTWSFLGTTGVGSQHSEHIQHSKQVSKSPLSKRIQVFCEVLTSINKTLILILSYLYVCYIYVVFVVFCFLF